MSLIIVDVESDGPIPAEFSMVCFGAVLFDEHLEQSFYGKTRPISDRFVPEALAVSGFSREQHLRFDDPKSVMESFAAWLDQQAQDRPVFVSDNVAFDWQFINYYFHRFLGRNPFGFPGRRIGDLYAWSRMRIRRPSGKSTASPDTLTILWTTLEAMPRR